LKTKGLIEGSGRRAVAESADILITMDEAQTDQVSARTAFCPDYGRGTVY
jgi:hypothetical protein